MKKVIYKNRYNDEIVFIQKKDKITMSGGSYLRWAYENDYDITYQTYCNFIGEHKGIPISKEDFKEGVHTEGNVLNTTFNYMIKSSTDIHMIDPSGGPYLAIGTDMSRISPILKGMVEKIEMGNDKINCTITVKL